MADHRRGYAVPIGGVVAYRDAISPSGVGYDIACGNKAVPRQPSPDKKAFVGGTMGETSVILEGVENDSAKHSMYSTVHGAGRTMGRLEAKGKTDRKTGQVLRTGRVAGDDARLGERCGSRAAWGRRR